MVPRKRLSLPNEGEGQKSAYSRSLLTLSRSLLTLYLGNVFLSQMRVKVTKCPSAPHCVSTLLMCVCVCVRARACVCVCVCAYIYTQRPTITQKKRDSIKQKKAYLVHVRSAAATSALCPPCMPPPPPPMYSRTHTCHVSGT
jgi:hypothetical protein